MLWERNNSLLNGTKRLLELECLDLGGQNLLVDPELGQARAENSEEITLTLGKCD